MCDQSKRLEIQYQHSIYQQLFQNLKCSVNSTARQYLFSKADNSYVQIQEGLRIIFQFGIYLFGCRTVRLVLGPLKLPIVT